MVIFWSLAAIVFVVIELLTLSAFLTIWCSVGAVFAAIIAYFGFHLYFQIFIFSLVSLVSVVVMRPIVMKYLRGNIVPTNTDRLINEQGIVIKDIVEDNWGEVKIKGAIWSAVSIDGTNINAGSHVKIVAIEGAKLIVKLTESKIEGN